MLRAAILLLTGCMWLLTGLVTDMMSEQKAVYDEISRIKMRIAEHNTSIKDNRDMAWDAVHTIGYMQRGGY